MPKKLAKPHDEFLNTLLLLEYIWPPDYIRDHPELFFLQRSSSAEAPEFILILLAYFLKSAQLSETELKEFFSQIPPKLQDTAMTAYELILEQGKQLRQPELDLLMEQNLALQRQLAEEKLRAEAQLAQDKLRLGQILLATGRFSLAEAAAIAGCRPEELQTLPPN